MRVNTVCDVILSDVMSYHDKLCYVMSCHIMSYVTLNSSNAGSIGSGLIES